MVTVVGLCRGDSASERVRGSSVQPVPTRGESEFQLAFTSVATVVHAFNDRKEGGVLLHAIASLKYYQVPN